MQRSLILLFVAMIFLGIADLAFAGSFGIEIKNPLCMPGGASCVNDFPTLIAKISQFVVGLVAGLAGIMFVWAGILFVTSGGNPGKIESAKKAALYAAIGVAIALAGEGLIQVITAIVGTG